MNYRSHESLLALPEKLFYDKLVASDYPLLQKQHKGPYGYSFVCSNSPLVPTHSHLEKQEEEAAVVLEEVLAYLESMKRIDQFLKPRRVCIISSTRNQVCIK